jgi:hypothetical protein
MRLTVTSPRVKVMYRLSVIYKPSKIWVARYYQRVFSGSDKYQTLNIQMSIITHVQNKTIEAADTSITKSKLISMIVL